MSTFRNLTAAFGCNWPIRSISVEITALRDCVTVQHDRLQTAGHLDRAIGIATVHDVGGVGPRAEGLGPFDEVHRPAAAEAIAHAVGLGGDGPGVVEEGLLAFLGQAVPIEAGQHPQRGGLVGMAAQVRGDAAALGRGGGLSHGDHVARLDGPALKSAKRPDRIGGPRSKRQWRVDAPRNGDIDPRALLEEAEGQHLSGLHVEAGPGVACLSVQLEVQLGPGDGPLHGGAEMDLGAHEDGFKASGAFGVADQQVRRDQRLPRICRKFFARSKPEG